AADVRPCDLPNLALVWFDGYRSNAKFAGPGFTTVREETMSVEIDLSGRVALITGGTRGIGAGITERFLAAGADVHVCARREPAELPEIDRKKPRAHAVDVRDPEQAADLVNRVVETSGRLDALVNNAGGAPPSETASAPAR